MPSHRLLTLGVPQLLPQTGEPVRFRTRKHLALLIRLALEPGKRLSRDSLMELLWPEAPTRLARHSLAQAISVVRAKVGHDHLSILRSTVSLAEGAVEVDVHRLETEPIDVRGRFLEGFEIPESRSFEQWKDEWQARLAPRIRDALVRQMDAARRIGDFESVERRAQALHDLDPASEDAVRGLMEARAFVGDRSNALKAFARYETLLAEEFEAKPSADLVRMADLLREGRRSDPRPSAVSEAGPPRQRRFEGELLVGREREFSVLYDAWIDVRNRAPRIVVVTGDPGMGKTTIANAFASTCQMEGAVVARAQAYDAERELPFAVLAELVRQLTAQRAIGAADPEALSELSRLVPEIFAAFPGVPKPVEWSREIVPLRLADAFLKTVVAVAEESPLLLIVDDIHATDNASSAILHVLSRKVANARALVLLTARPSELRVAPGPAALAADTTIEGMRSLELEALDAGTGAALIARLTAHTPYPDLPEERVLKAGNGNPLAIVLLTREWMGQGRASLLRDLEALDTQPAARIGIPRAIGTVFDRQVRRLDAATRAALDLAAVLGRRLTDLPLYQAVELTSAAAGEALSRLQDEGLLREVRGELEFRNELIRAQAYYAVVGKTRQHLHRRVAMQLARQAGDEEPPNLEIAWHLLRASDPQSAAPYALAGAERAIEVGGPREAEQVLEVLLNTPVDEETSRRARLLLVRALIEQSKAAAAIPLLREILIEIGRTTKERAEISRLLARALYLSSDAEAVAAASQALKEARRTEDVSLIAKALFEFARTGLEAGSAERLEEARSECERLLLAPAGRAESMIHYVKAYCSYYSFDVRKAEASLNTAISRLAGSTELSALSLFQTGLGNCRLAKLDMDGAREALRKAIDLAMKLGDDSRTSLIYTALGSVEGISGNYTQAVELTQKAVIVGERSLTQPALSTSYLNLAEYYALLGDNHLARHASQLGEACARKSNNYWAILSLALYGASASLMDGNKSLALEYAGEAVRLAGGRGRTFPDAAVLHKFRVFVLLHRNGPEAALTLARECVTWFRNNNPLYFYTSLAVLAWVERIMHGEYSAQTKTDIEWFENKQIEGRRRLNVAQGFLI
jgi:DNA-binding SARP family transcriptional activator/tetratricopeptide (TPR) repeat protein